MEYAKNVCIDDGTNERAIMLLRQHTMLTIGPLSFWIPLSQRRNEAIRRLKTKCSTLKKIRFPHTGTIMGSCLCLFGWILLWIKLSSNIIAQKLELWLFVGLRWVGASLYMKAKETHRLWWVHIHRYCVWEIAPLCIHTLFDMTIWFL